MIEGCVPWPADVAARYRQRGWWEGLTIPQLLERSAARHPQKTALVCGDLRLSYADLLPAHGDWPAVSSTQASRLRIAWCCNCPMVPNSSSPILR